MAPTPGLTIAEARDALRSGTIGALELTEACLAAAERAGALNAFSALTPELARTQAREAEARLRAGDAPDLCGIPLGIKDLFCVEGEPAQAASRILQGFRPPYESTVTAKLWEAGAVCVGKLNMDEFAMGSSNEHSVYGPAVSPWRRRGDNRGLTPGGSSGGSAAAVAADIVLGATGTDTGGSIRQPAAFTGIVGRQADLRALLALGDRRLRLLARPGRAAGEVGQGRGDHAAGDGRARPEGRDFRRPGGAGLRGGARRRHARQAHRHSEGVPRRGHAGRDRGALAPGRGLAPRRRRRDRRHLTAAYPVRAAGVLRHRPGRGLVEPRPLRRGALRAAGDERCRRRHHRTLRADPRRGVRGGGAAAGADRHLRALGRVLRRLLPPGAEGPHPDPAGFRGGLRRGRPRDPDPRDARPRPSRSARWPTPTRWRCI